MNRLICLIRGHKATTIRYVTTHARPGGTLPTLDGTAVYEEHPDGDGTACTRCRTVLTPATLKEPQ